MTAALILFCYPGPLSVKRLSVAVLDIWVKGIYRKEANEGGTQQM